MYGMIVPRKFLNYDDAFNFLMEKIEKESKAKENSRVKITYYKFNENTKEKISEKASKNQETS